MNERSCALISVSALLLVALLNAPTVAQRVAPLDKIQNQEDSNKAITALDAALFDAYNKCDLAKFGSFIGTLVRRCGRATCTLVTCDASGEARTSLSLGNHAALPRRCRQYVYGAVYVKTERNPK